MWQDSAKTVEDILSHLAIIITGLGGVWLALREIFKRQRKQPHPEIMHGQSLPGESQWLLDLRADAEEADELRKKTDELRNRLQKALIRLAQHGLPTDDI